MATDWNAVVRQRLAELSDGTSDDVLVEELALHVAQIYDDALADSAADAEARSRAMQVLDASDLLRTTIATHRGHQ